MKTKSRKKCDSAMIAVNYIGEVKLLSASGSLHERAQDDYESFLNDLDDCDLLPEDQGIWVVECDRMDGGETREEFMDILQSGERRVAGIEEIKQFAGIK